MMQTSCSLHAMSVLLQLSADALPYYTMSSLPPVSEQTYQCQVSMFHAV